MEALFDGPLILEVDGEQRKSRHTLFSALNPLHGSLISNDETRQRFENLDRRLRDHASDAPLDAPIILSAAERNTLEQAVEVAIPNSFFALGIVETIANITGIKASGKLESVLINSQDPHLCKAVNIASLADSAVELGKMLKLNPATS